MYEEYSKQALPSKYYRELLGTAICVFNSNNSFIIENILKIDNINNDWYNLIDMASGELQNIIKDTISKKYGTNIAILFNKLVSKRNRIIHSFQITAEDGEQILATKDKKHNQFIITEEYLKEFIKENQGLSTKLYEIRDFLTKKED